MERTTLRRIRKRKADNKVYLCAPVNSLVEGIYEQNIPFSEIKKYGDFGLGTFNDLDGEMMMIDGDIFRVGSDGKVNQITDEDICTPFACVTNFQPASDEVLEQEIDAETGRTKYVRKGTIKVDGSQIWDNRYMAGEELPADSTGNVIAKPTIDRTLFKGGSNYYPGLLIRQIK